MVALPTLVLAALTLGAPPAAPMPAVMAPMDSVAARVDATPELPLAWVEAMVLARNPTVEAARDAWREAAARSEGAGALDPPMLDLMAAPRTFARGGTENTWSVELQQPLPLFGRRGLERAAARPEVDSARQSLAATRLDLLRDARTAYYELFRVARAREANREVMALMRELRQSALARYSAGTAEQMDPLQAEVELTMLDHDAEVLDREDRLARARLNVLMHRAPDAALPPPPATLALPDTAIEHEALGPRALALRPELRRAEARVETERARAALARRARLPMASVRVGYDRFMLEPDMRPTVGVALSLPIVAGPAAAARRGADAAFARARAENAAAQDQIALEVEIAAARFHARVHDVTITRDRLVPLAERTVRAARVSYASGRGDFRPLLESVRDYLRARVEATDALAMLHEARADLDHALGVPPPALPLEDRP